MHAGTNQAALRRPVAEAAEAAEGSPAWAIDQLLMVPHSRLYATAAVASSSPNLQVSMKSEFCHTCLGLV